MLSALNLAVHETDFGENLRGGLQSCAVSQATSALQFGTGELKMMQGITDGSIGACLLHGVVGCLSAEASGGDCGSGFIAGLGTELMAGMLADGCVADPTNSAKEQEAARKAYENRNAGLVGAALGFLTSSGKGVNVSQGSLIATSAVEDNRPHIPKR